MPTSTPNDRTTPPSTPPTVNHSHISRPPSTVSRTISRYIDPHDGRPAVWPHDHWAPREYRPQDGLYDTFTWDPHLSSSAQTTQPLMNTVNFYPPQVASDKALPLQRNFTRPTIERDTLQLTKPPTPVVSIPMPMSTQPAPTSAPRPTSKSSMHTKSTSKPNTVPKPSGWVNNIRKKRRPSQIFNINFSFSAPSQRSASDHTPQISPRSSFSSESNSIAPLVDETFKRQRTDSSGPDVVTGFPFGKPLSGSSMRGRDLASSSNPLLHDSTDAFQTSKISSRRLTFAAADAHPGQLVDFGSPDRNISLPAPNPLSEYRLIMSTETHQDHLTSVWRRRSFPTGEQMARQIIEEFTILDKSQTLDTTQKVARKAPGRVWELEQKDRAHANEILQPSYSTAPSLSSSFPSTSPSVEASPATPSTPLTSMSMQGSTSMRRTISDPSAEAFLKHIRTSLEARKSVATMKWQDYPVFVDGGFLDDDEPL